MPIWSAVLTPLTGGSSHGRGFRERRVGGNTTDLATEAAQAALDHAGTGLCEVDLLIVSTNTPDLAVPAVAALVQHRLGLQCGVFDLTSGCSVCVRASRCRRPNLRRDETGTGRRVGHRLQDRRPARPLDGCSLLATRPLPPSSSSPGTNPVLGWDFGADGGAAGILYRKHGEFLRMNGQEVFRRSVRIAVGSAKAALENSKVRSDEIALFVPHQGNLRIIEAVADRLGLSENQIISVLDHTGNTSSASIPYSLTEAAALGRLRDGDMVLLTGFGAGLTWAGRGRALGKRTPADEVGPTTPIVIVRDDSRRRGDSVSGACRISVTRISEPTFCPPDVPKIWSRRRTKSPGICDAAPARPRM